MMGKNYKLIVNFSVRSEIPHFSYLMMHHLTMWVPEEFVEKMKESCEDSYARETIVTIVCGWMRSHMFGNKCTFTLLNHTVWDHKGNLIWEGEV